MDGNLDRIRELTERLQRVETEYERFFALCPDWLVIVDREGFIQKSNTGVQAILGYSPDELLGKQLINLVFEPDRASTGVQFQVLEDSPLKGEFRNRWVAKDGSNRWIQWSGSPWDDRGLTYAIGRDITREVEREEELLRSERRYRLFIRRSAEGIWHFDVEEPIITTLDTQVQIDLMYKHGILTEANEALAIMYGFSSPSEMIGARLGDLMPDNEENREYLSAFVEAGYSLTDGISYEIDAQGNNVTFVNDLIGVVENGRLTRAWGTQRRLQSSV